MTRSHPALLLLLPAAVFILSACKEKSPPTANDFMHSSKFEELTRRFEDPARDAWQKPDLVVRGLGNLKGKTVADLGAGTGYFSVRLAQAGASVVALDVDEKFLDYLRQRKEREGADGLIVRKTGMTEPALEAGEADILFTSNVYHHIENREEYFRRARAGLKPGGRLVIVDFKQEGDHPVGPPPKHRVSLARARTELEAAGFSRFKADETSLPYQYILTAWP